MGYRYKWNPNWEKWIRYERMVHNLSNEEINQIIMTTNWERKLFPWELYDKKFYNVTSDYALRDISSGCVVFCRYNDKPYYFNIGTEEPEITEDMINNAYWAVYSWSD